MHNDFFFKLKKKKCGVEEEHHMVKGICHHPKEGDIAIQSFNIAEEDFCFHIL